MAELVVFLVSGGSGTTAGQVMRACLAQFPSHVVRMQIRSGVVDGSVAGAVVDEASSCGGVICHTLVNSDVRNSLVKAALARNVTCVDLFGPTLAMLGDRLECAPLGKAGLLYELHREEFDRMDAIDFTMAHDDGQRLHDLERADVVVVGLSRVSKSVTCFYLAVRGVRAANVPLGSGLATPPELLGLDPGKVYGLTMNAAHLSLIRQTRLNRIAKNHHVPHYADQRELRREIQEIDSLIAQCKWHKIDVSYKATEEVASEIMDSLAKNSQLRRSP